MALTHSPSGREHEGNYSFADHRGLDVAQQLCPSSVAFAASLSVSLAKFMNRATIVRSVAAQMEILGWLDREER